MNLSNLETHLHDRIVRRDPEYPELWPISDVVIGIIIGLWVAERGTMSSIRIAVSVEDGRTFDVWLDEVLLGRG